MVWGFNRSTNYPKILRQDARWILIRISLWRKEMWKELWNSLQLTTHHMGYHEWQFNMGGQPSVCIFTSSNLWTISKNKTNYWMAMHHHISFSKIKAEYIIVSSQLVGCETL